MELNVMCYFFLRHGVYRNILVKNDPFTMKFGALNLDSDYYINGLTKIQILTIQYGGRTPY